MIIFLGRTIGRDDELGKWQRKQYHNQNQLENSAAYKFSNGRERQGPRALIDAYGSDNRKATLSDRPLLVERLETNGLDHRASSMSWQHTEEEEFDWEDMSPTLADRGTPISSLTDFKARPGFVVPRTTRVESDTRNSWSSHSQLPSADDSSIMAEDAASSLSVCFFTCLPLLFTEHLIKSSHLGLAQVVRICSFRGGLGYKLGQGHCA